MRCYLLRDNQVTVLAQAPAKLPSDAVLLETAKDLDQVRFPLTRLVALWNALPGVDPVTRFQSRQIAIKRLWDALGALSQSTSRTGTKQAILTALLSRPSGASMDDLVAATSWQPHSVRGVLSGVLRKKLGLSVSSAIKGDVRIYRIAA